MPVKSWKRGRANRYLVGLCTLTRRRWCALPPRWRRAIGSRLLPASRRIPCGCRRAAPSSRAVPSAWRFVPALARPRARSRKSSRSVVSNMNKEAPASTPLLQVRNLARSYTRRGTLGRAGARVQAAINISFTLAAGTTLGLAGSSGSGKSTVARCVSRIERPEEGEILFAGRDLARLSFRQLRPLRPALQMIFQDAATAMNPRFSAAEIIAEPLLVQGIGNPQERAGRARDAMREVGLPADWAQRAAHEFSGGQRQRLTLARALVLKPQLLILDEPLTGLDVSTRAQIANLLLDLQAAHGIAYILISHDLRLLSHLADRIAIMAGGRLVEEGTTAQIMSSPQHAETRNLLTAASREMAPAGAAR